jgi:hypothetical protein
MRPQSGQRSGMNVSVGLKSLGTNTTYLASRSVDAAKVGKFFY